MRMFLFTDLDDTLFQTLRKCKVPHENVDTALQEYDLTVGALSREGLPLSFMTARQRHLLNMFSTASVIPVTARNLDAFQRVRLSFSHGAVLNYGGMVLLPDGSEDMVWQERMRRHLKPHQNILTETAEYLTHFAEREDLPVRIRVIRAADYACYVVIKNVDPQQCFLERVRNEGVDYLKDRAEWCVHLNDNNLAFIPAVLNKAHAVKYVIQTYIAPLGDDFLTLGMGDSLVDLDFMNICHYALVPSGSQIQKVTLHE